MTRQWPPYQQTDERIVSRRITVTDETVTVFDVDIDDSLPWTMSFQELGVGYCTGKITYRRNLVETTQDVTIGQYGGDFITGIGPFKFQIEAGPTGADVNCWWTKQPFTIDVGVFTDKTQTVATATSTPLGSTEGWIPYPYNCVSIFSSHQTYQVTIANYNRTAALNKAQTITPPTDWIYDKLLIPQTGRVIVTQTSGSDQTFTPVYSRY